MNRLFLCGAAALGLVACGQPASNSASAPASTPATSATTSAATSAAAPAPSGSAAPAAPTPSEVRAMVQRDGAQATVAALWNATSADGGSSRWDAVETAIASGDQAWLDLYPLLAPGTDAGTAEGIGMALTQALTTDNAAGALRVMSGMGAETVTGMCQDSTIEPTPEHLRTFYSQAIARVEAISDPALASAKATCLTALRANQPAAAR